MQTNWATLAVVVAIGALAGTAGPVAAQNLALNRVDGPAEMPPSSFEGRQYVDSRGCVFLRAGVGGQTNWVPRVSRDRKVICGQSPTQVPASARTAAAPVVAAPVAAVADRVVRQGTASAAAARVAATRAAPRQMRVEEVMGRPAAAPIQQQFVRVAPAQPTVLAGARPGCGASALSARYIDGCNGRLGVLAVLESIGLAGDRRSVSEGGRSARVAPQQMIPVQPVAVNGEGLLAHGFYDNNPVSRWGEISRVEITSSSGQRVGTATSGSTMRVTPQAAGSMVVSQGQAPAQVRVNGGEILAHGFYDNNPVSRWGEISRVEYGNSAVSGQVSGQVRQQGSYYVQNTTHAANLAVSTRGAIAEVPGYRAAFTDGRLNPDRGLVTRSGIIQGQTYWTDTVPRAQVGTRQRGLWNW